MHKKISGGVSESVVHDSAIRHVTGQAVYTDDIAESYHQLHAALLLSPHAHARIVKIDLSKAWKCPGVEAIITADDIPGVNEVGPIFPGETALASGVVQYAGEPIVAVAAKSESEAKRAVALIEVEYEVLPAAISIEDSLAQGLKVAAEHTLKVGDSQSAIKQCEHVVSGEFHIGGQDHFYLEGQVASAVLGEGQEMLVYSSTQHPSEVQKMVAQFLGIPRNQVRVEVRRMGGGFGGKETQPAILGCIAALLSVKSQKPVKLRLNRDDDMIMTGKRHHFLTRYKVGFDNEGRIGALEMVLAAGCGQVADLSTSILDRALFHSDNCYFLPNATLHGIPCKTNTVSNTAFRGFGGPQGMLGIENVMDHVARYLKMDPVQVRIRNYYGTADRNLTPYHQTVEDNIIPEITEQLLNSSQYFLRKQEIEEFNAKSRFLKKGLAFSPVKFGISFTTAFLNQAGALMHIYADGSVYLNHGGTEMGQGLFTKVAQIVAEEFQIDLSRIRVSATDTAKVPNTSATAASSGTDMNGKAAQIAARILKQRLVDFAVSEFKVKPEEVIFHNNRVTVGERRIGFSELVNMAHHARVSLSTTGFYKTPKIFYDRGKAKGRPFLYFAYGACVSEVLVDGLTGEYKLLRSDILHDVGTSINEAIDIGQIEGAFVQGAGWLTMEELYWDSKGHLKTHAPSTYKIPTCRDIPLDLRVEILKDSPNQEDTVYRSKAVGEPPLMLANAVWLAIKDAVSSFCAPGENPNLNAPATPEAVLKAIGSLS